MNASEAVSSSPAGGEPAERRRPDLSVVVPSVNGWGTLRECLEALADQRGDAQLEILVADRVGDTVRQPLRERFSSVRLLEAPPGTTIPRLRALAFEFAHADVVGVIEDHVIVPPDWTAQMLSAQRGGASVVGGAIDNAACDRLVDWAAFLCEYHHCIEPPPAGPASWVPGNNVTYRRSLLERFRPVLERERWENALHDAMRDAGVTLESRPEIRVGHKMHFTVWEYVRQRYFYSRSFAAMRLAGAGAARRAAYGVAACALPPLLFYRIVTRVWRTGRHRRELIRSVPLFLPFVASWAVGEIAGAWFGPGRALAKVC